MNILVTSAGRRNYLIAYFRSALAGGGKVFAADASPTAPALQDADWAFVVPPIASPDYLDTLFTICLDHNVRMIVPTNDLELPRLAQARERFLEIGTVLVVSSPAVVRSCFDKAETASYLSSIGVRGPRTFTDLGAAKGALSRGELAFPVIVKPRWGTASIAVERCDDLQELEAVHGLAERRLRRTLLADVGAPDDGGVIVQEMIQGQEYGLDVVNDLGGRFVGAFLKRKLVMRAGETDKAEIVEDPALRALARRLGEGLKHVGNLDCDVIVDDDGPAVIEMNPRFGGGYPFSHEAGADLPAALIAWVAGRSVRPDWFRVEVGHASAKSERMVVHRALGAPS